MTKLCPKCKQQKAGHAFGYDKRATTGLRCWCRACDSKGSASYAKRHRAKVSAYAKRWQVTKRGMSLVSTAKQRAVKRGLEFDLHLYVDAIQARINAGRCEVSGIPFRLDGGRTFDSASIDRIDPKRGYVYSNIRIVCSAMNAALGDWGEETLHAVLTSWNKQRARKRTTEADGRTTTSQASGLSTV